MEKSIVRHARGKLRTSTAIGAGAYAALLGFMPAGAAEAPRAPAPTAVGGQAQKQVPAMQTPVPQAQVPQKQNVSCVAAPGAAGQKQAPQGAGGQQKVLLPPCPPAATPPVQKSPK